MLNSFFKKVKNKLIQATTSPKYAVGDNLEFWREGAVVEAVKFNTTQGEYLYKLSDNHNFWVSEAFLEVCQLSYHRKLL